MFDIRLVGRKYLETLNRILEYGVVILAGEKASSHSLKAGRPDRIPAVLPVTLMLAFLL